MKYFQQRPVRGTDGSLDLNIINARKVVGRLFVASAVFDTPVKINQRHNQQYHPAERNKETRQIKG